jgi:hypothetical protein
MDVSGSMYRFNGEDRRLERMLEAALLVWSRYETILHFLLNNVLNCAGVCALLIRLSHVVVVLCAVDYDCHAVLVVHWRRLHEEE